MTLLDRYQLLSALLEYTMQSEFKRNNTIDIAETHDSRKNWYTALNNNNFTLYEETNPRVLAVKEKISTGLSSIDIRNTEHYDLLDEYMDNLIHRTPQIRHLVLKKIKEVADYIENIHNVDFYKNNQFYFDNLHYQICLQTAKAVYTELSNDTIISLATTDNDTLTRHIQMFGFPYISSIPTKIKNVFAMNIFNLTLNKGRYEPLIDINNMFGYNKTLSNIYVTRVFNSLVYREPSGQIFKYTDTPLFKYTNVINLDAYVAYKVPLGMSFNEFVDNGMATPDNEIPLEPILDADNTWYAQLKTIIADDTNVVKTKYIYVEPRVTRTFTMFSEELLYIIARFLNDSIVLSTGDTINEFYAKKNALMTKMFDYRLNVKDVRFTDNYYLTDILLFEDVDDIIAQVSDINTFEELTDWLIEYQDINRVALIEHITSGVHNAVRLPDTSGQTNIEYFADDESFEDIATANDEKSVETLYTQYIADVTLDMNKIGYDIDKGEMQYGVLTYFSDYRSKLIFEGEASEMIKVYEPKYDVLDQMGVHNLIEWNVTTNALDMVEDSFNSGVIEWAVSDEDSIIVGGLGDKSEIEWKTSDIYDIFDDVRYGIGEIMGTYGNDELIYKTTPVPLYYVEDPALEERDYDDDVIELYVPDVNAVVVRPFNEVGTSLPLHEEPVTDLRYIAEPQRGLFYIDNIVIKEL